MGNNFRTALKVLTHNRLQALLTLCGMSVGVAMVVIVSGLGRGAQLTIESQIESAGPTRIVIRSGNFRPAAISGRDQDSGGGEVSQGPMSYGFDDSQAHAPAVVQSAQPARGSLTMKNRTPAAPLGDAEMRVLTEGVAGVRAIAGAVEGNVSLDADANLPVRIVRLHGFQAAWPDIEGWALASGRQISPEEHAGGAPLAIVSAAAAARLWPREANPLGKTLRMGGHDVRVVGVLAAESGREDSSATTVVPPVSVPLALAQTLLQRRTFDSITVRTTSVGVTSAVAADITAQLRKLRDLPADTLEDFRVETQSVSAMPSMGLDPRVARAVHANVSGFEQASWEEMARSLRQAGRTFALLLAAAAAVSLLVGGIGVMNIMLVSVAARTREIGLRMAMGARTTDVLTQFLVEAVTLAALGGLIGLVLGTCGLMVARYGLHWATAVSPGMLLLAVLMAAATGVAFGFGPARRAAVLDPVIALRAE
jgi:putative ABC transport system permease protein